MKAFHPEKRYRLNANENFYGCSSRVITAVKKSIHEIPRYPDFPIRLEKRLAEKFRVDHNNIVVGAGSVRLIDGIIQTFVEPGEEIIIFERSFVAYGQLAKAHRRKCVFIPQNKFVCDVENVFPAVNNNTKVIFIANPNNPTGTIISHAQVKKLLTNIPQKILVVIDEAYGEYVTDKSFPDSLQLQKKYANLVILRTFSKIYGLAGLRIGYAISNQKIAEAMKSSRIPFFFNSLSEIAAMTALEDDKFVKISAQKNAIERDFLCQHLKKAGLSVIPSQGNFIYLHFENENEKRLLFDKLTSAGIIACNLEVFGQDKSIRISVGDKTSSELIIKAVLAIYN